jgi:flagellar hook-length control protein FliK
VTAPLLSADVAAASTVPAPDPNKAHVDAATVTLGPAPAATGPAVPTTGAAAPSYVQTPTPATQLAAVILPLRDAGDGVHRVVLQLHPEDLGHVQVRVELRGHELHLQLAGASDATRDVLRAALGDLRRDLATQGFAATTIDVSADSPGAFASYGGGSDSSAQHRWSGRSGPRIPTPPVSVTTPSVSPSTASSSAGIDVRV